MIAGIADTHAAIWYLNNDDHLSLAAGNFIDAAADRGDEVGISSITLIETIYLVEKGRIPSQSLTRLVTALERQDSVFVEIPVDLKIAQSLVDVDRGAVPDVPDRIIAATALYLNVPIISRDAKIQLSGIRTLW